MQGSALAMALLLAGCAGPTGSSDGPETVVQLSGPTMGTRYTVKLVGELSEERQREVSALVEETLAAVDEAMSTWRDDSELMQLNRWPAEEPFAASPELLEVLTEAEAVSQATGGAFDVTVAPLVDAWGFGPPGQPPEPPPESEIEALLAHMGHERLHLDAAAGTVTKDLADLHLDLSAIAKGYAVDRVAEALVAAALPRFMVEVGGEVRTAGTNARGEAWRIAVERPSGGVQRVVELAGEAMATSGDYRSYYEVDGQRLSHTIDPRTGRPIAHSLASVSVVEPTCMRADALATALMVLGLEGPQLAEQQGLAALFLWRREDGSFREQATPAFTGRATPAELQ